MGSTLTPIPTFLVSNPDLVRGLGVGECLAVGSILEEERMKFRLPALV